MQQLPGQLRRARRELGQQPEERERSGQQREQPRRQQLGRRSGGARAGEAGTDEGVGGSVLKIPDPNA